MPEFFTMLRVNATRYDKDTKWTHDCGITRVKAGQWCVEGEGYGPCVFDDEEFREKFTPVSPWDCPTINPAKDSLDA